MVVIVNYQKDFTLLCVASMADQMCVQDRQGTCPRLSNQTCWRSSLGEMITEVLSGKYEHRWQDVPSCIDSVDQARATSFR